jgi:hypothetical protein
MTKYFDSKGTYKAYTNDDKNLFSESGEHIGYFSNGFLYDPKDRAIAHVKGKQIIAKNGQILFYRD